MLVHRGLREVLGSLAEIGYDAEWQDIRASDVGAPHKRERIWIVAYPSERENDGRKSGIMAETERRWGCIDSAAITCREDVADAALISKREQADEADTIADGRQTWDESINSGEMADADNTSGSCRRQDTGMVLYKTNEGKTDTGTWERVNQWSIEPDVGMLVDGLSSGLDRFEGRLAIKPYKRVDQLKGLGNAIVPQIAEILFRQIKDLL